MRPKIYLGPYLDNISRFTPFWVILASSLLVKLQRVPRNSIKCQMFIYPIFKWCFTPTSNPSSISYIQQPIYLLCSTTTIWLKGLLLSQSSKKAQQYISYSNIYMIFSGIDAQPLNSMQCRTSLKEQMAEYQRLKILADIRMADVIFCKNAIQIM